MVLSAGCAECGWQPGDPTAVAAELSAALPRWEAALARDDASERPAPTTWSTVEYACHVRDMVRLLGERTTAMLTSDDPRFENWDGNEKAVELDYHSVAPADISRDMARWTAATVEVLDGVEGGAWQRPGHRSDGAPFTVATLAQFNSHEVAHHLRDVQA